MCYYNPTLTPVKFKKYLHTLAYETKQNCYYCIKRKTYSVQCLKNKIVSVCHKSELYSSLTFPLTRSVSSFISLFSSIFSFLVLSTDCETYSYDNLINVCPLTLTERSMGDHVGTVDYWFYSLLLTSVFDTVPDPLRQAIHICLINRLSVYVLIHYSAKQVILAYEFQKSSYRYHIMALHISDAYQLGMETIFLKTLKWLFHYVLILYHRILKTRGTLEIIKLKFINGK